jgi:hypothetical protein
MNLWLCWTPRALKTKTKLRVFSPRADRPLSAKLMPTFADRGCRVVSATDPYGYILGFLDQHQGPQMCELPWSISYVPDCVLTGLSDKSFLFFQTASPSAEHNPPSASCWLCFCRFSYSPFLRLLLLLFGCLLPVLCYLGLALSDVKVRHVSVQCSENSTSW